MEAKIASKLIKNAGEYNGFLKIKPEARILSNSIEFQNGFFITPKNWKPEIDMDKLGRAKITVKLQMNPLKLVRFSKFEESIKSPVIVLKDWSNIRIGVL